MTQTDANTTIDKVLGMIDVMHATAARCLLVWGAATATAAPLLALLASATLAPARGFDDLLVRACSAALLACTAWGWLCVTAVVVEARSGRGPGASSPGVPRSLRRLVLRACGLALVGATAAGVVPAAATPDHLQQGTVLGAGPTDPLVGLPLPQRAAGAAHRTGTEPVRVEPVRVEAGDSLWSLSAAHLADGTRPPDDAAVAAYWPRVHAANHDVVGPDPDLLLPGQVLRLPPA